MNTDLITTIANVALTLSFIAALIFGLAQVKAAARDRRERLTLSTLEAFQTREFAELIYTINNFQPLKTWNDIASMSAEDQIKFIQFGQEMESLGLLVAERLIDLDLVDKTLGSFVASCWDKFKLAILDGREILPDPFLSEYFQWLAECIAARMQKMPRQPYFLNEHHIS